MPLSTKFPPYRSQLLRMWVEHTEHQSPVWRFSLENISTGERNGFADLDALICYLLELMEEQPPDSQGVHRYTPKEDAKPNDLSEP